MRGVKSAEGSLRARALRLALCCVLTFGLCVPVPALADEANGSSVASDAAPSANEASSEDTPAAASPVDAAAEAEDAGEEAAVEGEDAVSEEAEAAKAADEEAAAKEATEAQAQDQAQAEAAAAAQAQAEVEAAAEAEAEAEAQAVAAEAAALSIDHSAIEEGEVLVICDNAGDVNPEAASTAIETDGKQAGDAPTAKLAETMDRLGMEASVAADAGGSMGTAAVAELPEGMSVEEAIVRLSKVEGVASVQPNFTYELLDIDAAEGAAPAQPIAEEQAGAQETDVSALAVPNDPYCKKATSGNNQYYLWSCNFPSVWDTITGVGTEIAVIDTGCLLNHEDLKDNIDTTYAYDVFEAVPLGQGICTKGDEDGHGTKACGIIAAQANNGLGIAGASYNAKILPIKVSKGTRVGNNTGITSSTLLGAYTYLDGLIESGKITNLHVINISLGTYQALDDALHTQIAHMRTSHNVLTVCAGGNGNGSTTAYTKPIYPGDWDECFEVTALNEDGTNCVWSDYNMSKDISAPGHNIWTTANTASDAYTTASGSSFAAPLVSAAAALLWAYRPELTPDEVVNAIETSATPVNPQENDHAGQTGSAGALNVLGALDKVKLPDPEPEPNPEPSSNSDTSAGSTDSGDAGSSETTSGTAGGGASSSATTSKSNTVPATGDNTPVAPLALLGAVAAAAAVALRRRLA